jgi:hypothetical protein
LNLLQHDATQNVGNFWFEIGLDLPGHLCVKIVRAVCYKCYANRSRANSQTQQ